MSNTYACPRKSDPQQDSYTYDPAGAVTAISTAQGSTTLDSFNYGRDNANQVTSVSSTGVPADNHSYSYNSLEQLTARDATTAYTYNSADDPTGLLSGATQTFDAAHEITNTGYSYDSRGNRMAAIRPGLSASYTYNEANQLVSETTQTSLHTIATKNEHTVAVKTDGTVWDWGLNTYGQLGNNTTTNSHTPVQVSNLTGAVAVGAGDWQTVALKSDGSVWDWGRNATDGQLGNGNNTTNSSVPVQVSNMSGAVAVGAGGDSTFAVKSNGTLWGWGSDASGQLCNNSTTNSDVPVQASNLTGVVAMSEGYHFTVALKSDGTVWTCGQNDGGQLGNGTTTNSSVPVQVSGLTGVVAVNAGDDYGMALKADDTIWTWGHNEQGQLGNNSTTNHSTPVQVSNITNVVSISGEEDAGMAVKSDGTVWDWGLNNKGQLGNGTMTNSHVPVQANNLTSAVQVAGGLNDSVVIKSDGTLWAWGYNNDGEFGNGTTTNSNVPTESNMTSVATSIGGSAVTYTYNGDGLRTAKTQNGVSEQFTYDQTAQTPLILVDGVNNYIFGPDGLPLEQITSNGTVTWYHHDQLGSTRLLTNGAGTPIGTATYDPYGNVIGTSGASTPFGFAGAYADHETGLLYLINRYYDTVTAQFQTIDPLLGSTAQPYGYVANSPLNGLDPRGLDPCVNSDKTISGGGCYHEGPGGSELSGPYVCSSQGPDPYLASAHSGAEVYCSSGPLVPGTIRPGSSAEQARSAATESGFQIPDNYVAERAGNGQGWVFRAPGTSGNANTIRVMEPNAQNPTGYVRYYNSFGQPLDAFGNPGSNPDTHLPLRGGGDAEDPEIPDLGFESGGLACGLGV